MARDQNQIVLIVGQDSWRSDRALASVLSSREVDPSEVVRIWGDESSFLDVFAAAASRSLFSDRTVVVVRRAEKLRGAGGREPDQEGDKDESAAAQVAEEKPKGRKPPGKAASGELPEMGPHATLVLVARAVDRRIGIWKKVSKVAEVVDADYLKGRTLTSAAAAEARALGLRLSDEVLQETVEQSGPSLGRIVSEFEKMVLHGLSGQGAPDDLIAATSPPPLYLLSDALMVRNRKKSLVYLDDAMRQGEAGLKILAALHGSVRRVAVFRALREQGVPSAEAAARLGILPFKVMDTERAARAWSEPELSRAFAIFAEADRRLKLSAPAAPILTHVLAQVMSGGRA